MRMLPSVSPIRKDETKMNEILSALLTKRSIIALLGMMDGAYFVSRKDILDWLNDLLSLNLTKIEQTASGAVACQVIEYIYPGSVPLHRVNWEAKSEYEYVQNYKLLQASFTKNRVQRHVDVPRLIRAKYQDNLEFCQWLKAFFEQAAPPERLDYDPVAARSKGKGGKVARKHFASTSKQHNSKLLPTDRNKAAAVSKPISKQRPTSASNRTRVTSSAGSKENKPGNVSRSRNIAGKSQPESNTSRSAPAKSSSTNEASVINEKLMMKNKELESLLAELELTSSTIEKERDFYFGKLRDVEIMCQIHEEANQDVKGSSSPEKLIKKIFKVLYATIEENVEVDDDGNIVGYTTETESDILDDKIFEEDYKNEGEERLDDFVDDKGYESAGVEVSLPDAGRDSIDIEIEKSFQSLGVHDDDDDDDLLVY